MSRKFKIKNVGEKKFKFENLKYYNLIKKVYDRFDGEDYTKSSMGVDYIFLQYTYQVDIRAQTKVYS